MLQKMENVVKNEGLANSLVKKEGVIVEENIRKVGEKRGLKLDFEKPNRNVQKKLLPKASISKVETTGNSKLQLGVPGGGFKSYHIDLILFDPVKLLMISLSSSSSFISSIWFSAFVNCFTWVAE